MARLCGKCGYERQPTDHTPETECPRCGVIYARIDAKNRSAQQAQQVRLAGMIRRKQAFETDRTFAGLFTFGWMLTPVLVQGSFFVALLLCVWVFVTQLMDGNAKLAIGALVVLVTTRIALESVMVMFRIADDLGEVRQLLTEQSVDTLRDRAIKEAA